MTPAPLRNPETSLSASLRRAREAIRGQSVTLRELLMQIGEQGLLIFCAVLALPFMLPVTIPFMSTICGVPMLLIGFAVTANRMPWLPDRVLNRSVPAQAIIQVLVRAESMALRFEHLVRPRLLGLSGSATMSALNGIVLLGAVGLLMMPLPLMPFANTLPAIGILLLCLGMAERDGVMLLLGYFVTLLSTAYIGALLWLVIYAGANFGEAWELVKGLFT